MKIKKLRGVFDLTYFIKVFELISFLSKSTKKKFIFIVFAMFINSLLEFITIGSMIPFITFVSNPDKILEINILKTLSNFFNIQTTDQLFLIVSIVLIIIISLSGFIKILNIKLINDFGAILRIELGKKLYKKILYKDYEYHLNTNSSYLISSQIDHLDSAISLIGELMRMTLSLLTSIGIIVSLFVINSKIVFFVILSSFTFYLIASISTKKYNDIYGKIMFDTRSSIIKVIQESLGFIGQVILDDSHKLFIEEYNKDNKQFSKAASISATIGQIPRYLMEVLVLSVIVISIIYMYLTGVDFYGYVSVFGAFTLGLQKLLPLFQKTFGSLYQIRQEKFSLDLIVKFLKETEFIEPNINRKNLNILELKNTIRFENICSNYKENKVLENINIEIKKGDVIGIVGKTGAGKSTFIDLLLGLKKPSSGNIFIDENKMDDYLFREFRSSVSSVPQDYFLLDRTIEENIVVDKYKSAIDYDLLKKVVDISMLNEFINSLRNGYKTFVGENGIRLSGGQKQRLAIARALYKRHSFLILDEATSAVDLETEKKILNKIVKGYRNITVIMIAHRLQTLEKCDYIFELKNKTIIKHKNIKDYQAK